MISLFTHETLCIIHEDFVSFTSRDQQIWFPHSCNSAAPGVARLHPPAFPFAGTLMNIAGPTGDNCSSKSQFLASHKPQGVHVVPFPAPPPLLLPQGSKKQSWVFCLQSHICAAWSKTQEHLAPRLMFYFSKYCSEGTKNPHHRVTQCLFFGGQSWPPNPAASSLYSLWQWAPEERGITLPNPSYSLKLILIQQDLVGTFLGKSWVSVSQWQVGPFVMCVRWGGHI